MDEELNSEIAVLEDMPQTRRVTAALRWFRELARLRASHEAIRAEIPQLEDLAGEPAYGLPLASAAARRVVSAWRAAEPK